MVQGMAGGKIVIFPPLGSGYKAEGATIIGNTCLYEATCGQLCANGKAGERFVIRNSLAEAVIEENRGPCLRVHDGWLHCGHRQVSASRIQTNTAVNDVDPCRMKKLKLGLVCSY